MVKSKSLKLSKRWRIVILLFGTLVSLVAVLDKVYPLNLSRYQDVSTLVYGENKTLLHVFLTKDDKYRIKTQQREVSTLYIKTLLAREDKFYPYHFGINPLSILRASTQIVTQGKVVSGGSTLTMQTARLLEPRPRKISSKLIECFRAMQLEWHFSKAEILNIYLTLAPFGGNIEGVKAAALSYFNKSPKMLSPPEVALLVAMVQSPNALRPDLNQERARHTRNGILQLMAKQELITLKEARLHQAAPLPQKLRKFPKEIPHLAWRLKQDYPWQNEITSTINLNEQKKIEKLLKSYQPFLPQKANVAILILDHVQNKPLVYVASRDYLEVSHHGFIDYIQAIRSPGSTLKPFIYGIAFDLGILQPETYLLDKRRRFGSYHPRNFDKDLHGMVRAKEALVSSLNIPAVSTLNEIGVIRFLSLLKEIGVNPKMPKDMDAPGLSCALGGLGLTLEQLVLLYSGLGNSGKVKHFSYIETKNLQKESYLLSSRAACQVMDILTTDNSAGRVFSLKTGTSYGHRDALAIGFDKQYVVGVWIGCANGSPMRGATGAGLAVPLLHKIYQILPPPKQPFLFAKLSVSESVAFKNLSHERGQQQERLSLQFPIDKTVIPLAKEGIPCSVRGGNKPYHWLINGKPVFQSWQQRYLWQPERSGFYTFTVIDAQGQSVNAHIEIT